MKYWNKIFYILIFLGLVLIFNVESCKSSSGYISGESALSSEKESNTTSMDFGIMDESYNFTNDSSYSASELAERFPVETSSKVSFLKDEHDYFKYRLDLMDAAQDCIYIQTYIFDDSESSWEVARKLVEARKRGVEVKLIVDISSIVFVKHIDLYNYLKINDIEFEGYEIFYSNLLGYIPNNFNLDTFINTFNTRRHEKIFIIDPDRDNARAIIGGTNIANEYFGFEPDNYKLNWKDQDIALKGKIVRVIANEFLKTWDKLAAEAEEGKVNVLGKVWDISKTFKKLFSIKSIGEANPDYLRSDTVKKIEKVKKNKVSLNYKKASIRYIQSDPTEEENFIYQIYLDSINRAKESIDLVSGYFIPPIELREALLEAVKRGVKVRIIANSPGISDLSLSMVAGRLFYSEILKYNEQATGEGSIKIYEWQGDVGLHNGLGLNHSKYGIFDNKLLLIGSFNLDPRSKNLNSENLVATDGEEVVKSMAEKYQGFLSDKYVVEITKKQAKSFKTGNSSSESLFIKFAKDLTFML